jgi:hypothetical protein
MKKYKRVRNALERARDRLWHQRHYIPVARPEPDDDPAEIERRIAHVRREKDLLRFLGREEPCNPQA